MVVRGQRPGHREGAGAEDLRQAPLRLEVPSPEASRADSRASASPRPRCTGSSRPASRSASRAAWASGKAAHVFDIQLDTRKNEAGRHPRRDAGRSGTRSTARASSSRSWPTGSRASASSTATSSTPRSRNPHATHPLHAARRRGPADGTRQARQRDAELPAGHHRAAEGSGRDQAAPARRRAGRADAHGAGVEEPRRPRLPADGLQPRLLRQPPARSCPRCSWGKKLIAAARPRGQPRDGRGAAQGHRGHEAHEPAHELPEPDRRRADDARASSAS